MATSTSILGISEQATSSALRTELENLLLDLYSVVGVAPQRPYEVIPADLLTEDFQGRIFIRTSSELMSFNKTQMLAAKLARGGTAQPESQLLSMEVSKAADGSVTAVYAAAFRAQQTATVRSGSFQAVKPGERWMLRSIDEDVRVILMPEATGPRVANDHPRVWFI
jgi:hypothetical protein